MEFGIWPLHSIRRMWTMNVFAVRLLVINESEQAKIRRSPVVE